jgi:hypothetical protein
MILIVIGFKHYEKSKTSLQNFFITTNLIVGASKGILLWKHY